MARHPSSGGPGPRPPLGGNGGGSGRAALRETERRASGPPAPGARPWPAPGRLPLSRAAGSPCFLPSAAGNVVAFLLQANGERRFLILAESSISPARGAAWPAPFVPGIAAHRSGVAGARRVPAAQSGVCDPPAGCVMSNFTVPFVLPARCSGTDALFICGHFFAPETNRTARSVRPLLASNARFGSVATGVQREARARRRG